MNIFIVKQNNLLRNMILKIFIFKHNSKKLQKLQLKNV